MKTHFTLTLNGNEGEYADECGGFILNSREHALETIEALLRGGDNIKVEIAYLPSEEL